jgi:hypothetical protein
MSPRNGKIRRAYPATVFESQGCSRVSLTTWPMLFADAYALGLGRRLIQNGLNAGKAGARSRRCT